MPFTSHVTLEFKAGKPQDEKRLCDAFRATMAVIEPQVSVGTARYQQAHHDGVGKVNVTLPIGKAEEIVRAAAEHVGVFTVQQASHDKNTLVLLPV